MKKLVAFVIVLPLILMCSHAWAAEKSKSGSKPPVSQNEGKEKSSKSEDKDDRKEGKKEDRKEHRKEDKKEHHPRSAH
jgi:hypothetical protein